MLGYVTYVDYCKLFRYLEYAIKGTRPKMLLIAEAIMLRIGTFLLYGNPNIRRFIFLGALIDNLQSNKSVRSPVQLILGRLMQLVNVMTNNCDRQAAAQT